MRSAFDKLISWTGVVIAGFLLVAGGLLTWANTYIDNQVHDQLAMQDITMPAGDALASLPKADAEASSEEPLLKPLSDREREILQLIAKGVSNSEAAKLLNLSKATIRTHLEHIYRKLEVTNRVEAVTEGIRKGLISV